MAFKIPGWKSSSEYDAWNAMKQDYENKNFNSYMIGPGSELDPELQPGAMSSKNDNTLPNVKLYIRNIPKEMSDVGVANLCTNAGKIVKMLSRGEMKDVIRLSEHTAFVTCLNINESEAVMNAINSNTIIGMKATFAKETTKQPQLNNYNKNGSGTDVKTAMPDYLDMDHRQIKGPFSAPTKLQPLMEISVVAPEDYDESPKLKANDPNMDFCGEIRNEFSKTSIMNTDNVANGVSNYRENENVMNGIKNLSNQRKGQFFPETNGYNYQSLPQHALIPPVGQCSYCQLPSSLKCEVCGDFYCSLACQNIDWPKHKHICRPMPKLVPVSLTVDLTKPMIGLPMQQNKTLNCNNFNNQRNGDTINSPPLPQNKDQRRINEKSPNTNDDRDAIKSPPPQEHNTKRRNNVKSPVTDDHDTITSPPTQQNRHQRQNNMKSPSTNDDNTIKSPPPQQKAKNNVNYPTTNGLQHKKNVEQPSTSKSTAENTKSTKNNTKIKQLEIVPFPESGTNVVLSAVLDHRSFYIRSLSEPYNNEYIKDANDIADYSLTAKLLTKLPERGDIILAEFEGAYYRALALNVTDANHIKVAYVDFGNTAEKRLNDLREITDELRQRKRFTHKIVLENVPKIMLNEKCLDYLHELVNELKSLKIQHTEQRNVTLNDTDRKVSLENYLIKLNDVQKPTPKDDVVMQEELKRIGIKGDDIDVLVLDTSCLKLGYIACCTVENFNEIIDKNVRLQEYCKTKETQPYTPKLSEVCLAKYDEDDTWYRGILIEAVGDGNPSIMFIDYGNISIVSNKNIRRMPKEFAYPLYTLFCIIDGLKMPITDKLADRLKELLPVNEQLKVKKSTIGYDASNDVWSTFELPDIIAKLKAENLI